MIVFISIYSKIDEGLYKIIATNLHNLSMPLLRYDTGDLSDGTFVECCCKKGLKLKKPEHLEQQRFIPELTP